MGKTRYTIETLASGQPRPYADTIHHVRVHFEWNGWQNHEDPFVPNAISEEAAKATLLKLPCGFIATPQSEAGFMGSYLAWLRPVDGKPSDRDPNKIVASIWEFQTVQPYTG